MKFYAVVDTNVLVAALLSKNSNSATVQVILCTVKKYVWKTILSSVKSKGPLLRDPF